jgi:hypothetical protein
MTNDKESHRQRHIELHQALDELAADWIAQQPRGKLFSNTTIMELLQWSFEQTKEPTTLTGSRRRHSPSSPTEA